MKIFLRLATLTVSFAAVPVVAFETAYLHFASPADWQCNLRLGVWECRAEDPQGPRSGIFMAAVMAEAPGRPTGVPSMVEFVDFRMKEFFRLEPLKRLSDKTLESTDVAGISWKRRNLERESGTAIYATEILSTKVRDADGSVKLDIYVWHSRAPGAENDTTDEWSSVVQSLRLQPRFTAAR